MLPSVVREVLGLRPGDTLRYRFTDAGVLLDKPPAIELGPFATFFEWSGKADEKAYADL